MATAAIGGSHLVASTQAGAQFGWQLVLLVFLVNVLKYPFFRAGVSYTMSTGETLQHGYLVLGKGYLLLALALNALASVVNAAALLMFAASLLGYFFPFQLAIPVLSTLVLSAILFILIAGHYSALDKVAKIIMITLVVATVSAAVVAWQNGAVAPPDYVSPSPWTMATVGFLVVTMGWMPAPIEISGITSLWLKQQREEKQVTAQSALFDFNLGYLATMLLALVFLALGALVLHGNGESLASGGIGFSKQLVSMYADTIGEWARWLIAIIAFLCIFGSALTVYDGYSRAVAEALVLLKGQRDIPEKLFVITLLAVATCSFIIVLFFKTALLAMLAFAMTLAFVTTPVFAFLNHKLVNTVKLNSALSPRPWLNALSYFGLVYLFGFLGLFLYWKWLL
ncbi:NRAMP family divalent metal transporter [Aestuariibacter sp. A3R04]|uniref:NRAMP family divalent metal transporter n=1 Tax=Aestuariibacter sp. A3R04 TaxID=2841571 RepID=UPI0020906601|nr:divalent metal cation transporter [Aestuariibacter sp. A3R04]